MVKLYHGQQIPSGCHHIGIANRTCIIGGGNNGGGWQQCVAYVLFSLAGIATLWGGYVWFSTKEIPSREKAIKKSKVVWGCWFTGGEVEKSRLIEKTNSIKRILLLAPDSIQFKRHIEITPDTEENAKRVIISLTKQALNKDIEVRWYSDAYNQRSITIYNPDSDKAWLTYQVAEENIARPNRVLYSIKKTDDEEEFKRQQKIYDDIWNHKSTERKRREDFNA